MRLIRVESTSSAFGLAAGLFMEAARAKPAAPIGLATGGTMEGIYSKLSELSFKPDTKHAFALDEYEGLRPDSPNSYAYELNVKFVQRLAWGGTLHVPGAGEYSGEAGLDLFEAEHQKLGPISVQLLGLGSNGHVAFNEPGADFDCLTRRVELDPNTRRDNSRFFERLEDVPTHAFTQGLATIRRASALILVALGNKKLPALTEALSSPSDNTPLAALLDHPDLTVVTDQNL